MVSGGSYKGHGDPNTLNIPATLGKVYVDLDSLGDSVGPPQPEDSEVISTGTTESRTLVDRFSEFGNIRDFGDESSGTALAAALVVWDRVLIEGGSFTIPANVTIAANKTIVFQNGGKIKPASGVTITINGEVQAGRHEIFDYTDGGKVVLGFFSRTNYILPEWYGAKADNTTTNNDTPFSRIFDQTLSSLENQQEVLLDQGYYDFSTGFTGRSGMILIGHPNGKTRLQLSPIAVSGSVRFITIPSGCDNIHFERLQINVRAVTAGVRTTAMGHASSGHTMTNLVLRDVTFSSWNEYGIDFYGWQYGEISSCNFSISNTVAAGGTAVGSAVCINIRTFGNAIHIGDVTRTTNCECFINCTSAAGFTIDGECAFEQGASSPVDLITGRSSFIYFGGGRGVHADNCYFEGIATDSTEALFTINNCKGWSFSRHQITGVRPAGSVSMSDILVSQTGTSYGGSVSENAFYGEPDNFYIKSDGAGGNIIASSNVYMDNTGGVLTNITAVQNKISIQYIDFTTPSDRNFVRPQVTRIYSGSTAVVDVITAERRRTGGADSAGGGVRWRSRAMNGSGSMQNFGDQTFIWVDPSNTSEVSDYQLHLMGGGPTVEALKAMGRGGLLVRGDVHVPIRTSAVNLPLVQADGLVLLTASGLTATIPNSDNLPIGQPFMVGLMIGGVGTGTLAFANGTDRIQPANSATYSLSADGKFVKVRLVAANTWFVVDSN